MRADGLTLNLTRTLTRFEQKDYDKCIETCKKGVEVGREVRDDFNPNPKPKPKAKPKPKPEPEPKPDPNQVKADFKIVAKSYARIGNAYIKQARVARGRLWARVLAAALRLRLLLRILAHRAPGLGDWWLRRWGLGLRSGRGWVADGGWR